MINTMHGRLRVAFKNELRNLFCGTLLFCYLSCETFAVISFRILNTYLDAVQQLQGYEDYSPTVRNDRLFLNY